MSRAPRHSPWVLALACAFASGAFVGSGYAETIHTLDGRTLKKAIVAGLSPAGATIKSSSGVDTIAYEHWPPKLRKRYGYDPVELSKYVHEGIDGAYAYWKVVVFEGEHLTLERGRFSYAKFSDVIEVGAKPKPPITGSYQMIGQWVIFDSPEVPNPARVLVVVEGRLAMMTPYLYKRWKDSGKFRFGWALFRVQG